MNLIVDRLIESVWQQKPWLFTYDNRGRITKFHQAKQNARGLLTLARKDFKGFHMFCLLSGLDYKSGPPLNKDGLRFMQLKSIHALMKAGKDLQNCLQNAPGKNDFHINYHQEMISGSAEFVALCGPRGDVHDLLRIVDSTLLEASGKQSALLNQHYMDMVIDYVCQRRLGVSDQVFRHGVVVAEEGIASYLELGNPDREETLHITGDLSLDQIQNTNKNHGVAFEIRNVVVDGNLSLINTHIQSMTHVSAHWIKVVDCPLLEELDVSVKAKALLTDSPPDELRLHTYPGTDNTAIDYVTMYDGKRGRHAPQTSIRFTGTEYATMYSADSNFMKEFAAMFRAMRPARRDGGSGPSSSTPQQ